MTRARELLTLSKQSKMSSRVHVGPPLAALLMRWSAASADLMSGLKSSGERPPASSGCRDGEAMAQPLEGSLHGAMALASPRNGMYRSRRELIPIIATA